MRLALVLFAALAVSPAMAGTERCQEPYGPVVPDGNTATQAEMRTAKAEVLTFIEDSDTFQSCLIRVMDDPKEKVEEPQKRAIMKDIEANQREKEAVAAAFNAALKAYKARGLSLE